MNKNPLTSRLLISVLVGGLVGISPRFGNPQGFWKTQDQRRNNAQNTIPVKKESALSFQQAEVIGGMGNELSERQISVDTLTEVQRVPTPTATPLQRTEGGNSGIRGTTRFRVISGIPKGRTTEKLTSIEFAIAPVENDKPAYSKAILVRSDAQGTFEVVLPPGKYWVGPKAKALDPGHYTPGPVVFSERTVVVTAEAFTYVELVETGYAP